MRAWLPVFCIVSGVVVWQTAQASPGGKGSASLEQFEKACCCNTLHTSGTWRFRLYRHVLNVATRHARIVHSIGKRQDTGESFALQSESP